MLNFKCREAIALLEDERLDLILLDLNLSDGNGFRVVEALRMAREVGGTCQPLV